MENVHRPAIWLWLICLVIAGSVGGWGLSWYGHGGMAFLEGKLLPSSIVEESLPYLYHYGIVPVAMLPSFLFAMFFHHPTRLAIVLHGAVIICLMAIFWIIITHDQFMAMPYSRDFAEATAVAMISGLPLALVSVAPAKAISRRLIFLALGLVLLIALNELSKLGLDVTAPKLQG